ncbi:MAG: molecular chaperone DnaJ [Alphaproteobacteria bacterium]|nr:molecular chaperone DnaJ [Alphaproteobacteria bacterium]
MPRRDYYAVLGVARDAPPEEIKKAFRALAMLYHPDRNPDDADAEGRFREIVEAWECLGDPEERFRYDRLGPLYRPDGKPPSPDDVTAAVQDVLGSLFRRKPPPERGEDLRYSLSLSLEEAATGTERSIEVRRQASCRRCHGNGAEPEGGTRVCDTCGGSGKSPRVRLLRPECPRCDGRGFIVVKPCTKCDGGGRVERTDSLKVRVPPGVATGQKLKLRDKGNVPRRGSGTPGDLFVLIDVQEHPLFRRRGADLFCEVPITLTEAALGADLQVPVLDGVTTIRVPAGTPSGRVLRLGGRGLPVVGGRGKRKGDLHYRVVVEVPSQLSEGDRRLLDELSERLSAGSHPERSAFRAALEQRR